MLPGDDRRTGLPPPPPHRLPSSQARTAGVKGTATRSVHGVDALRWRVLALPWAWVAPRPAGVRHRRSPRTRHATICAGVLHRRLPPADCGRGTPSYARAFCRVALGLRAALRCRSACPLRVASSPTAWAARSPPTLACCMCRCWPRALFFSLFWRSPPPPPPPCAAAAACGLRRGSLCSLLSCCVCPAASSHRLLLSVGDVTTLHSTGRLCQPWLQVCGGSRLGPVASPPSFAQAFCICSCPWCAAFAACYMRQPSPPRSSPPYPPSAQVCGGSRVGLVASPPSLGRACCVRTRRW